MHIANAGCTPGSLHRATSAPIRSTTPSLGDSAIIAEPTRNDARSMSGAVRCSLYLQAFTAIAIYGKKYKNTYCMGSRAIVRILPACDVTVSQRRKTESCINARSEADGINAR